MVRMSAALMLAAVAQDYVYVCLDIITMVGVW